jgi:hypothetical protein
MNRRDAMSLDSHDFDPPEIGDTADLRRPGHRFHTMSRRPGSGRPLVFAPGKFKDQPARTAPPRVEQIEQEVAGALAGLDVTLRGSRSVRPQS